MQPLTQQGPAQDGDRHVCMSPERGWRGALACKVAGGGVVGGRVAAAEVDGDHALDLTAARHAVQGAQPPPHRRGPEGDLTSLLSHKMPHEYPQMRQVEVSDRCNYSSDRSTRYSEDRWKLEGPEPTALLERGCTAAMQHPLPSQAAHAPLS